MKLNNGNRRAMPSSISIGPSGDVVTSYDAGDEGLTKREYFAGLAMQSIIANQGFITPNVGRDAIRYADALLKELEKDSE